MSANANALSPIRFNSADFVELEYGDNVYVYVNVLKSSPDAVDASVEFSVTNGTAIEGTDFNVLTPSPLTWSGTDTTPKIIEIEIINDSIVEQNETFQITLSNPQDNNEIPQAVLGTITTTTVTILDYDPAPGSMISVVSGDGQSGAVGDNLEDLVIQLAESTDDIPVSGATIEWEVSPAGAATLQSATTVTGDNGRSANTITLNQGGTGPVTVIASTLVLVDEVGIRRRAEFTINTDGTVTTDLSGLTPNERRIAAALDNTCDAVGQNAPAALATACSTQGAARLAAIQQLVPSQLPSQGNYSVELQHNQFMNINSRLVQLRAGATGANASDLSLNFDGQPLLTRGSAYLLSHTRGGGASADEPESMGRLGFFINGSGSFGDRDTTEDELGLDFTTEGISTGVDYRVTDEFVVGGALGYVSNGMDFENSRGDQDITGYTLSAYGTWYQSENTYIDGILSYGTNSFDMTRHIQFGATDVKARGDTDGTEIAVSLGGGYDFNRNALNFGPFARLNYIKARIDAFEENSADGLELVYDSQDADSLSSLLGGQATYVMSTRYGVITPQMRLEWAHEFKHDSRYITARFLNDPTSGRFEIATDDPDRDFFNLGLGVSAVFTQGRSAFLYYEAVAGRDNLTNHSVAAGVRFEF
ncbi:MAG: autotransporter domain-containing protein [Candidatus Thiodiazotropha sp.]